MSELPISSPYRSQPDAPVSEAERDRLSARLNAAFTAGSLDAEAYQSRLDALFAARRLGELVPVVQGLPPADTSPQPAIVASDGGRPGELIPARSGTSMAVLVAGGAVVAVVLLVVLLVLLL